MVLLIVTIAPQRVRTTGAYYLTTNDYFFLNQLFSIYFIRDNEFVFIMKYLSVD